MPDSPGTPPSPPDGGSVHARIAALLERGVFKRKGAGKPASDDSQRSRREALERSVSRWHRDPLQRGRLAELHEETAGYKITDASRLSPAEVVNLLTTTLDRTVKRLGHFKPAPPAPARPPAPASLIEPEAAKAESEPPAEEEAPPPRDWIDIQFVGMDDKGVSGIKYKLKLPGGKTIDGTTASKGLIYLEDLDSGDCELTIVSFEEKA